MKAQDDQFYYIICAIYDIWYLLFIKLLQNVTSSTTTTTTTTRSTTTTFKLIDRDARGENKRGWTADTNWFLRLRFLWPKGKNVLKNTFFLNMSILLIFSYKTSIIILRIKAYKFRLVQQSFLKAFWCFDNLLQTSSSVNNLF